MTRDEAAVEVGRRLSVVLAEAGIAVADTAGNLKEPLDDALRAMGYAETDLATAESDDAAGLLAMLRYQALRTAEERLAAKFDLSTGGDSFRLSQIAANVRALLARAEADAIALFGSLVMAANGGLVLLEMPFLEPDAETLVERYG